MSNFITKHKLKQVSNLILPYEYMKEILFLTTFQTTGIQTRETEVKPQIPHACVRIHPTSQSHAITEDTRKVSSKIHLEPIKKITYRTYTTDFPYTCFFFSCNFFFISSDKTLLTKPLRSPQHPSIPHLTGFSFILLPGSSPQAPIH